MALTPSTMLPLGTVAPDFTLPDTVTGQDMALQALKSDMATVIMFICNHCPYVKHVSDELANLAKDYQAKGVSFIAISSNDITNRPEDSPENMKQTAHDWGLSFPYLYDETQEVAKAYQAACTPDFYIFDGELRCVYRGQLDDSRPNTDIPVTGKDLRTALDSVLSGEQVSSEQKPSMGCNIKWKS
ncbi:thioredoxin family protein [Candidatus Albibeggiatoa sp. nov. NOAA]|uniref:thioredoxin family protein n=1 Tax=Candidatus Albibeggiatoa sp. nov. NOAA TaxID=3162724 RepID=UPI0032FB7882|nr:thioredoxin family protein [Thiotrichaceae bacterium]